VVRLGQYNLEADHAHIHRRQVIGVAVEVDYFHYHSIVLPARRVARVRVICAENVGVVVVEGAHTPLACETFGLLVVCARLPTVRLWRHYNSVVMAYLYYHTKDLQW
jgi:hypothetical protein